MVSARSDPIPHEGVGIASPRDHRLAIPTHSTSPSHHVCRDYGKWLGKIGCGNPGRPVRVPVCYRDFFPIKLDSVHPSLVQKSIGRDPSVDRAQAVADSASFCAQGVATRVKLAVTACLWLPRRDRIMPWWRPRPWPHCHESEKNRKRKCRNQIASAFLCKRVSSRSRGCHPMRPLST